MCILRKLPNRRPDRKRRAGFTLVEVMIASAVGTMVICGALTAYMYTARAGMSLTSQTDFNNAARYTIARFTDLVESAKTYEIEDGGSTLVLYGDNGHYDCEISYNSGNASIADDSITATGSNRGADFSYTIAKNVSRAQFYESAGCIVLSAHIGDKSDDPNDAENRRTGRGYQGIDVLIAAKPRDAQMSY